jgi:gamma-glutamyl-gamma-aminobutyrate hydrolase PuuD
MKYLLLSLILIGSTSTQVTAAVTANQTTNIDCKLPKAEKLTIGCTTKCGRFNSWAIKWYAKKLGYKVKLVNLRSKRQTIDYTQVDGIIIPGGSDIDPKWYKNNVTPDMKKHIESIEHLTKFTKIGKARDEFEFDLLSKYFRNQNQKYQPILGICRGMQVLTASQGIPLYVDIKTELGIKNRRWKLDRIKVTHEESLIKEVIGRSNFRGVELHHQGLNVNYFNEHKAQWPYLNVTSLSNGGHIAESLEFYNRPILGVQFHPEYTFGAVRRGVYKWLLKRSCFNHQFGKNKGKGL